MIRTLMRLTCAACLFLTFALAAGAVSAKPKKLLVVTVTKGFRHQSIPVAEKVLQGLSDASKEAFTIDYARTDEELAAKMTAAALKGYDGVVFASTTGDLPLPDREAFLNWIKAGHAFIGIHAATDTFKLSAIHEMIGGEFRTHGPQVSVDCIVETPRTRRRKVDEPKTVFDEIYVLRTSTARKSTCCCRSTKSGQKDPNYNKPEYHRLRGRKCTAKGASSTPRSATAKTCLSDCTSSTSSAASAGHSACRNSSRFQVQS